MLFTFSVCATLLVGPSSVWGAAFPRDSFEDPDLRADSSTKVTTYSLAAPDGSIKGEWLDWGATIHELWVQDRDGEWRDLIVGFDDTSEYVTNRQYFGPVVGRYANRIKNGTYSVPPTQNTTNSTTTDSSGNPVTVYNSPNNENDGLDTLHGGTKGWDLRHWSVERHNSSSITFSLTDPDGMMGFPGKVLSYVTYSLKNGGEYEISMWAQTTKATPILLSSHTFWNLEAYHLPNGKAYEKSNPNATSVMMDTHHMQLMADRVVGADGILVPTGKINKVEGTAYDFRKSSKIGARLNETEDFCGTGCMGYDTCWIYEDGAPAKGEKVASFWSDVSGIRLDVQTNQVAAQVYTCNGINSTAIPRKAAHGGGSAHPDAYYGYHSCFVLEQESWIDAINQPEWGIDQILKPDDTYNWWASYQFSTFDA